MCYIGDAEQPKLFSQQTRTARKQRTVAVSVEAILNLERDMNTSLVCGGPVYLRPVSFVSR